MSDNELIVVIASLSFTTFIVTQIFKLVRFAIEKRHGTQEARDMQLREEFVKFRRQMEQRVGTLEATTNPAPAVTGREAPRVALPATEEESESRLPNMLRDRA